MTAQVGGASFSSAPNTQDKQRLRREMRQRRRRLSRAVQRAVAMHIARHLTHALILRPGRRVGAYLAIGGEVSLEPTMARARALGCKLFVPHIVSIARGHMMFYAVTADTRLRTNRWGIAQLPTVIGRPPIKSIELDVVLLPLVAFDGDGHRLGMGAGFYDRHFARRNRYRAWRRPQLVGVAYSFQQIERIASVAHDVGVDAVVTERSFMRFAPRR